MLFASAEESWYHILMKDYKIEIRNVIFAKNAMIINWDANIGWGQLTIEKTDNGYDIDTECLGDDFVKQCFQALGEYFLKNHNTA